VPDWPLPPNVTLLAQVDAVSAEVELLSVVVEAGEATKSQRSALTRCRERLCVLQAKVRGGETQEAALWTALWATPQATAWERLRWTREVAQYVRWKVLGEQGDLDASKEARQLADRLGLSPLAMLRLRWEVVEDEVAEQRAQKPVARSRRLKAVDPDAVAGS
jgi:hypothetical protein